jgi:hypothetical protein
MIDHNGAGVCLSPSGAVPLSCRRMPVACRSFAGTVPVVLAMVTSCLVKSLE